MQHADVLNLYMDLIVKVRGGGGHPTQSFSKARLLQQINIEKADGLHAARPIATMTLLFVNSVA